MMARSRIGVIGAGLTFSTHLRDQLVLDTLHAELLAVVDQTMQPTQASLWLRPSHAVSSAAGGRAARQ
jgi:hypothetical protein